MEKGSSERRKVSKKSVSIVLQTRETKYNKNGKGCKSRTGTNFISVSIRTTDIGRTKL